MTKATKFCSGLGVGSELGLPKTALSKGPKSLHIILRSVRGALIYKYTRHLEHKKRSHFGFYSMTRKIPPVGGKVASRRFGSPANIFPCRRKLKSEALV